MEDKVPYLIYLTHPLLDKMAAISQMMYSEHFGELKTWLR